MNSPTTIVWSSFDGRFSDSPRALYERLRFCAEQEKKRRNVRVIDQEPV